MTASHAASDGTGIDLHAHSTASDGLLSADALVDLAVSNNVAVLALTDHDTVDGLAAASARARAVGIELIPGVELSTRVDEGEVHVLGYYVDRFSPHLGTELARFRQARADRAATMVERLSKVGAPVDLRRVHELAGGATIGRPHVARALIEAGHARSVDDAFSRFLVRGRPGYVERYRLTPAAAVDLLRRTGAVPVLAHPHSAANVEALLPELLAAGLCGLECYYGDYDEDRRVRWLKLAERHQLIPTGGTDFHGGSAPHRRPLGSVSVPQSSVEALRGARSSALRT